MILATEPKVLIGTHLDNLKGLVTQWVNAEIADFDIWEITIETHEVTKMVLWTSWLTIY